MSLGDHNRLIDKPSPIRNGEELDLGSLQTYLEDRLHSKGKLSLEQFPSGYSNLTYFLKFGKNEFVMRRPPFGANIKSAHNMKREFTVLSKLRPAFTHIPQPVLYCDDQSVIGSDFFLMQRVKGIILRSAPPKNLTLTPELMSRLSHNCIDSLIELHALNLEESDLSCLGKPEGYAKRQVEGWVSRYEKSKTDYLAGMEELSLWLTQNIPNDNPPCMIHNDYKYDNIVLNPDNPEEILSILDWEMATVGDPMMDLGTTLAYWTELGDPQALKMFNLTWLPGNMNRIEILNYYREKTGSEAKNITFYYTYACFKLGVICQQIYARYKKGLTNDLRFAGLIEVVKACAENGKRALETNRISNF